MATDRAAPPVRPSPLAATAHRSVAAVRGATMAASARGLTPWLRRGPLPDAHYDKVFVVGCQRSGTTWVAEVFGRHPGVIGGAESNLYPTLEQSIGAHGGRSAAGWARLFYGYERGRALGRPTGLHHYVDRSTLAHLGRGVVARTDVDRDAVALLARGILDTYFLAQGGRDDTVLVEKTPRHVLHARRILTDFPEARLVEVVRDGRDACVSMQMRSTRVAAFPSDRRVQIQTWIDSIRAGMALRSDPALRDRVTVVHYEALEADPRGEVTRLFDETGLGATPELVDDVVAATAIDRYPTGAGEFRFRGRSGNWADTFTDDDIRMFREMVGDLFAEAGYSYDA